MNENRDALLERALSTIKKLREKLQESARSDSAEPIAIVGAACEFPGGIRSLSQYWQLLASGRCAVAEVPESRRYLHQLLAAIPQLDVRQRARHLGLVADPYGFDNKFFGISPKEALHLDPQHRMLLELTWRAFESACLNPLELSDSETGVFVGIGNSDYYQSIARHSLEMDAYVASGNAPAMAAGRLSYFFGLKGPSLAFDTACSSSLVGVNLACQALQRGDCGTALVAAVNLVLTELISVNFAVANMLAADGRCKVFSDAADGYVRAEGAAVLVLKKLSDALAAGDPILAVVRGSAVNQDGRSHGLTAPNGPSQRAVIEKAFADANVALDDIDYLEAHGTGTKLGDPVEVNTLSELMAERSQPLFIGSAKANLGHLEPAAGMAGLLKVIAALQEGVIPRQIQCEKLNTHVDWERSQLRIPFENEPWPHSRARRIAAVSSFGFSGTNAHVIVESAPPSPPDESSSADREWVFATSAASRESLQRLIDAHLAQLDATKANPGSISYTACCCRAHFPYRFATSFRDSNELGRALRRAQSEGVPQEPVQPAAISLVLGHECSLSLSELTRALPNHPLVLALVSDANEAWQRNHERPLLVERAGGYELAAGQPAALADLLGALLMLRWLDALGLKCASYSAWGAGFAALAHHLAELDLPTTLALIADESAPIRGKQPSGGFLARVNLPSLATADAKAPPNWASIVRARVDATKVGGDVNLSLCRGASISCEKEHACLIQESSLPGIVAALYRAGAEIRWRQQFAGNEQRKVALPGYEFSHVYFNVCEPIEESMLASRARTGSAVSPTPLYEESWKASALSTAPSVTPDLDHAVAGLATHAEVQGVLAKYARYTRMLDDAEALCERAALHLFKHGLGVEQPFELDRIASRPSEYLAPQSSHKPLVAHLARRLLRSPRLQDFARIPAQVLPEFRAFFAEHAEFSVEGELLQSCVGSLIDVIKGAADPKTILFSGGADSLASRVYKTSVTNDYLNKQVQLLVRQLLANHRGERKLRILEIGAGTGATTEMVVGELDPSRVQYDFTDISPYFLNLAQQRFGSLGCFDFQLLNIEDRDGAAALCSQRYDLIIAVNVLHATSSIDQSIRHVSELLLDGGVLILRECTKPTLTADLTFGLTPGWWLYTDFELRKDYPLLNCQQWNSVLTKHGFERSRTTLSHESGYENIIVARRAGRATAGRTTLVLHRNERENLGSWADDPSRHARSIDSFLAADAPQLALAAGDSCDVIIADLDSQSGQASPDALVDRYFHDISAVFRKLAESYPGHEKRVYVLTRGAAAVLASDGVGGLGQSLTSGLARVAAREFPDWFRAIVDVDVEQISEALALLEPEIRRAVSEQEIVYRQGARYVRRLAPRSVPEERPNLVRADASYLITGGLGGLGLSTAEWLAERGARHLVLLSRKAQSLTEGTEGGEVEAKVLALRQRGVSVVPAAVDVADDEAMRRMFQRFGAELPPLRGIIHSAGVGGDLKICDGTRDSLAGMFATKVKGSLNLHRLSQEHELDFFVIYSSMIATWGAVQRGHYAAVNQFSDQLIIQRNRLGLPGISLDWGPWSGSGMLKDDAEMQAKWLGVDSLKAERYLCTLGRLLDAESEGVAVAVEADWRRLYQSYSQHSPMFLFEELQGPTRTVAVPEEAARPDLADPTALRGVIRAAFADLLGYADAQEVALERGFFEQGMDSLLAIRFGEILHERLQVTVKTTDLFSYNSVAKLAEFLGGRGSDARPHTPALAPSASKLDQGTTAAEGAEPMSRSALLDALAEFEASLGGGAQ